MSTRGRYDRTLGPRERKRQQRTQLLLAAMAVFARRGYAGASVEAVVTEAGMSRKTFYGHFDDLEDVLAAVHERSAEFVLRHVEAELAAVPDPARRVEHGVGTLLGLVARNPGLARVLFWEVRAAGPRFEARQQKVRDRFAEMLRAELVTWHAQGRAARVPSGLIITALVAGLEAVGVQLAQDAAPGVEEATREMMVLVRAACA